MKAGPIAFRTPELQQLGKGLDHFRRLADGALADIRPGRRLWIREPYFLPRDFDGICPTDVLRKTAARPVFLADVGFRHGSPALGKCRAARELCRAWHRRHLVVTLVEPQRLQDISAADVAAGGYRDFEHFAELWDRDISMRGRGARWHDNPAVLRVTFTLVDGVVDDHAPQPRAPTRTTAQDRAAYRARRAAEQAERVEQRVEDNAAKARQALAELGGQPGPSKASVTRLLTPIALTAPVGGKTWCEQRQHRVTPHEGRSCEAPFCPMAPAKLEDAA